MRNVFLRAGAYPRAMLKNTRVSSRPTKIQYLYAQQTNSYRVYNDEVVAHQKAVRKKNNLHTL
ncbi:hypothetical protein VN23_19015 [Janthinobacterium sp. B9-8]|nr:hypothetical protein VN23_19015 [Janthinobacterium sp. B9-8]